MDPCSISITWLAPGIEISRFLLLRIILYLQVLQYIFHTFKFFISSLFSVFSIWGSLGMFDHTQQNLHDQLIDMKLHAQNQICTSFSFWDRKVFIASLGMPGHAWPHSCKIRSIGNFNRYVPACKKSTLYLK